MRSSEGVYVRVYLKKVSLSHPRGAHLISIPNDLSDPHGADLMHKQHFQSVLDCVRRHTPADCWRRCETARFRSFVLGLKLLIYAWCDEHSSGTVSSRLLFGQLRLWREAERFQTKWALDAS